MFFLPHEGMGSGRISIAPKQCELRFIIGIHDGLVLIFGIHTRQGSIQPCPVLPVWLIIVNKSNDFFRRHLIETWDHRENIVSLLLLH